MVNFSDIELSLQEILIRGDDDEALDIQIGASANQMSQTLAWKTMYNNILRLRESFVQKLIAGDESGIENRKAIVVLDAILKMPAALVEIGNRQKES